MALERTVLMEDGSVRSHHEVERITHIVGQSTVIDVLSWTEADKEGSPIRTILAHDYDDTLTVSLAHEYVSDLPQFEEYVDPAQEALEGLLPTLTDEQAESVAQYYPLWKVGVEYAVGDRRLYDEKLYRCVQAHTSQEGWEPPVTPAMWTRTGADPAAIEEWVQPTGAQDAYKMGDKVTHNDSTWVSDVDDNVWEPGVYGWTEVAS